MGSHLEQIWKIYWRNWIKLGTLAVLATLIGYGIILGVEWLGDRLGNPLQTYAAVIEAIFELLVFAVATVIAYRMIEGKTIVLSDLSTGLKAFVVQLTAIAFAYALYVLALASLAIPVVGTAVAALVAIHATIALARSSFVPFLATRLKRTADLLVQTFRMDKFLALEALAVSGMVSLFAAIPIGTAIGHDLIGIILSKFLEAEWIEFIYGMVAALSALAYFFVLPLTWLVPYVFGLDAVRREKDE